MRGVLLGVGWWSLPFFRCVLLCLVAVWCYVWLALLYTRTVWLTCC